MTAASPDPALNAPPPAPLEDAAATRRRHLRFGWWALLVFLTVGLALEGLHGLKLSWYIAPDFEIRRLMWTLGHAHGALLGIVNVAFAATLSLLPGWQPQRRRTASRCLAAASVLLPGGFLLGGAFIYDGDPGLGVALVPIGAVLLFVAVALTAWAATKEVD